MSNENNFTMESLFVKIEDLSISDFDIQEEIDDAMGKTETGEINLDTISISNIFKTLIDKRDILRLNDQFVEKYKDYFDWGQISQFSLLNEGFIEKYEEYVDWYLIPIYQHDLSQHFYNAHKEKFITTSDKPNNYIESPMNYTGTKYELLPVIVDNFPPKIDKFVDLFAGGFNVGINVDANEIICNDINKNVTGLYESLQQYDPDKLIEEIQSIVKEYNLEDVE